MSRSVAAAVPRRTFLIGSAALGVGVSFGSAFAAEGTPAAVASAQAGIGPTTWVNIAADGVVTIYSPVAEIGQGTMTAVPLVVAEELDADLALVRAVQAPDIPKIYGNPAFNGHMETHGSAGVRGYYDKLRLAGAQARRILLYGAAELWGVPVAELTTEPGAVVHAKSGRRVGYGALAGRLTVSDSVPQVTKADLKPISAYRYVGKDVPRLELPPRTDGSATYGIDEQQPGMLYASVVPAPVTGERPLKVDDKAAKAVPGIVKIVVLENAVGIIGETVEATLRAKRLMKVQWSTDSKTRAYTSEGLFKKYDALLEDSAPPGVEMARQGNVGAAMPEAARKFEVRFYSSNLAHASMEPLNATALVTDKGVEVWASTQSPTATIPACAKAADTSPENVQLHSRDSGGAFGRTSDDADYSALAVMIAKAVPGRPVKLMLTREDDFTIDKFRPASAQRFEIGLDAQGEIVAWRHRIVSLSHFARAKPAKFAADGGKDFVAAGRGGGGMYVVPNQVSTFARVQDGIEVGPWRGTTAGYVRFATESIIDEVAAATNRDPLDYRLHLLRNAPRAAAVVRTVGEMSDWKAPRPGRAVGIAFDFAISSYTAIAAEVSLDTATGAIKVHKIWCAIDCGVAVQPRNIDAQLEGAIIQGLGAALFEIAEFKNGEVQAQNFNSYRVMRMADVPEITTKVLATENSPGGAGEAAIGPLAPAIANAVARLTGGKRIRHLPMSPERVLAVLKA